MLKSLAYGVIATSVLALSGTAHAATLSVSFTGGPLGTTVYDGANGTPSGSSLTWTDGTIAKFSGGAGTGTGNDSGVHAAPYTGSAQETTTYFYAPTGGSVTFDLGKPATEIGFLWGSVDTETGRNQVTLYSGKDGTGSKIGQFDGSNVKSALPSLVAGNWYSGGSVWANITSTSGDIGSVVFSDNRGGNSFEFDKVSAVPLPGALPLFGTALLGLGMLARRRRVVA